MTLLTCKETTPVHAASGQREPKSWAVVDEREHCIVFGFGRKKDAEIAREYLLETFPFGSSDADLLRVWNEQGGRPGVMKAIGERLQW